MSEALSTVEIEDVLSSIRRLVSEDLRPTHRLVSAALQKSAAKLILTPALRIESDVRTALPERMGEGDDPQDLHAVLLEIEDDEADTAGQVLPMFGSVRQPDATVLVLGAGQQPVGADANFLTTAMSRINGLSSVEPAEPSQPDRIEAVVAAVGAAVGAAEWEVDGGDPAPQAKAWADTVWDSDAAGDVAPDIAEAEMELGGCEVAQVADSSGGRFENVATGGDGAATDGGDVMAEEHGSVADAVADGPDAMTDDTDAVPDGLDAVADAGDAALGDDTAGDAATGDGTAGKDTAGVGDVSVGGTDDSWANAPDLTSFAGHDWQADMLVVQTSSNNDVLAGPDSIVFHDASIAEPETAAPDAAESADDFDESASFISEDVLREIVRDMIREELQGNLGERITRNVRKLVRAEINRALASQHHQDIANRG